jgi:hypothetical protein
VYVKKRLCSRDSHDELIGARECFTGLRVVMHALAMGELFCYRIELKLTAASCYVWLRTVVALLWNFKLICGSTSCICCESRGSSVCGRPRRQLSLMPRDSLIVCFCDEAPLTPMIVPSGLSPQTIIVFICRDFICNTAHVCF